MSDRAGSNGKGNNSRPKYASLSLYNTYKGRSLETQRTTIATRHGLQSLGKVATTRRVPAPPNSSGLNAEGGTDALTVRLNGGVCSACVCARVQTTPASAEVNTSGATGPPAIAGGNGGTVARTSPPPAATSRSWAQPAPKPVEVGARVGGLAQLSQREFPSLGAGGEQVPAPPSDATSGRALNLRPQNVSSWREGGGPGGREEGPSAGLLPIPTMGGPNGGPLTHAAGYRPVRALTLHADGTPFGPRFGPPPGGRAYPAAQQPDGRRGARPPWLAEADRPSIVKANDLKELDTLDTDADDGWAGVQDEVDYTEKLKFSDDEDEERGGSTRSWADSAGPGAVSEGGAARGSDASSGAVSTSWGDTAPSPPPSGPGSANWGDAPVRPRPQHPVCVRMRTRGHLFVAEVSAAVERARQRRAAEEKRMEEERLAACAQKLRLLESKMAASVPAGSGGGATATAAGAAPAVGGASDSTGEDTVSEDGPSAVPASSAAASAPSVTAAAFSAGETALSVDMAATVGDEATLGTTTDDAVPSVGDAGHLAGGAVAPVGGEVSAEAASTPATAIPRSESAPLPHAHAHTHAGAKTYHKTLPPRFQRQQQEQLLKQQWQQWQQQGPDPGQPNQWRGGSAGPQDQSQPTQWRSAGLPDPSSQPPQWRGVMGGGVVGPDPASSMQWRGGGGGGGGGGGCSGMISDPESPTSRRGGGGRHMPTSPQAFDARRPPQPYVDMRFAAGPTSRRERADSASSEPYEPRQGHVVERDVRVGHPNVSRQHSDTEERRGPLLRNPDEPAHGPRDQQPQQQLQQPSEQPRGGPHAQAQRSNQVLRHASS
ncbi:unnamed protein product [Lampetra planeri]